MISSATQLAVRYAFGMNAPRGWTALIMTSDSDVDDVWAQALPEPLAGASAARKSEWIQGRIAVQRAFAKAGVKVEPKAFREGDPRTLASLPDWSFSLSHTSDWAFAWVASERSRFTIGVDIEDVSRTISDGVEKKFRRHDDRTELDAIHLWSLKEAAFKAVPKEHQKDLVVSSIVIDSNTFYCADRRMHGFWRQETSGELIRSFAWVDKALL